MDDIIIGHTRNWIKDVVIGCNFCPFAAKVFKKNIYYEVVNSPQILNVLETLARNFIAMDENKERKTSLLILNNGFTNFRSYFDLFEIAQALLTKEGYEGIYQLASFHPLYLFKGSNESDPSNYTNRSPYPMLHILREEDVSMAVDNYPASEYIPEINIAFTRQKGLIYMKTLLENCMR